MKTWILFIGLILLVALLFGCTQNTPIVSTKVTNDVDAIKVTSEVSTDLSEINNALNDIDDALVDKTQ